MIRSIICAGAVLFLAACSSTVVVTDSTRLPRLITADGLNLADMREVFVHGFTQVEQRALRDPDLDELFADGMAGLKAIDPYLKVDVTDTTVVGSYVDVPVFDVPRPAREDIRGWSNTTLAVIANARRFSELMYAANSEALFQVVFDAALVNLDPYSRYSSKQRAAHNRYARNGAVGIGLDLGPAEDGAVVVGVTKNGPADAAGLMPGDLLTHINDRKLSRQPVTFARKLLDGPEGTVVSLRLTRAGAAEPFDHEIRRTLIVPDTVTSRIAGGVVEIDIRTFNQSTATDVANAVEHARRENDGKLDGIVLDLRGDPGGLLDQAVAVADLFLEEGTIITTHGRHIGAEQFYEATPGDILNGLPIAILLDGFSASASEIVAAALQDNGRAVVVGTSSVGKGTVQTVLRLPNDGEVALTWSRVYAPGGYAIHGLGIQPDICTSGAEDTSAATYVTKAVTTSTAAAATRERWRKVGLDDAAGRQELRSLCPPARHSGRTSDMEAARQIVTDTATLARLAPSLASQMALDR